MIKKERGGFKDIFSNTLEEFFRKFPLILKSFIVFYLIPAIAILITSIIVLIITYPSIPSETISGMAVSSISGEITTFADKINIDTEYIWLIISLITLITIVLHIFLSLSYINLAINENQTTSEIFNKSKEQFWKYLGYFIVITIIMTILFALLIIPGIIFGVYWIFSFIILINENTKIFESLKQSKKTVKGRWWKVFSYLLLLGIIATGVGIISLIIPIIGTFIPALVIWPFTIIFLKNFYHSLKSQGF